MQYRSDHIKYFITFHCRIIRQLVGTVDSRDSADPAWRDVHAVAADNEEFQVIKAVDHKSSCSEDMSFTHSKKTSSLKDGEEEEYVRHSELWFTDGSVVLQAEKTRFRVHTSLLSRRSLFFRDMFMLPQPSKGSPKCSDQPDCIVDGCPLVTLHDSAEDVANLLIAFYDGPTFGNNDRDDFRVVSGILRLATKYAVDSLRDESITHLSVAWPTSLKAWDAREELASVYEAETGSQHASRYPSPIVSVRMSYLYEVALTHYSRRIS
jgi:hypothetical protein